MRPQIGVLHREGHDHDVEAIGAEAGDRQADAVHRDRPLVHDVRREMRREADRQPVELRVLPELLDVADRVDVPLDEVSAEAAVGAQRPLEVHDGCPRSSEPSVVTRAVSGPTSA